MSFLRVPRIHIILGFLSCFAFWAFGRYYQSSGHLTDSTSSNDAHSAAGVQSIYDFIVVGGGQSGLVLGNRLSEDGKNTVLVVEYGYFYHDDPRILRPWRAFNRTARQFQDPKLMYNLTATPQVALNNRRSMVEAGATVGGGSAVNGMFLNRGTVEDYDAWEQLGNPGWGWEGMLPYFRKSVTFTPPGKMLQEEYGATYNADRAYGKKGPIHVSNPAWAWPSQKIHIAGWKELGIRQTREGAGGDAVGVFWVPRAQDPKTETRSYSVTGHLEGALKRRNFKLVTGQQVVKILLSASGRAQSVQMKSRDGEDIRIVAARKEVVICAGFHTPVILQRSGIGPRHILEGAGIEVLRELPGVGMNFQDHPAGGLENIYKTDFDLNVGELKVGSVFDEKARMEYTVNKTGPYIGGNNVAVFLPAENIFPAPADFVEKISAQKVDQYLPDLYAGDRTLLAGFAAQLKLVKRAFTSPNSTIMGIPLAGEGYVLMILQKPLSRGTITIDPKNPYDGDPLIDFQTVRNPLDMEVMLATTRLVRKWTATNAMKVLTPVEDWPGPDASSDEDLKQHFRRIMGSSIGHLSGSCSMMPLGMGGVVGPDLLVHGVPGLSIADSSIIPLIPSTNLCATVYAVAEKAADIIKKRHGMKFVVQM